MNVQTKILLLLCGIVAVFVGGLVALKITEEQKFKAIADERATERNRIFDEFLDQRGDNLKVLVEDSSTWDGMVRAVVKGDLEWAAGNINDETLATYNTNAIWIYKADHTLFFSRNNRYADNLREIPLPPEALANLFSQERTCHFFIRVPQGWMEVRGGTIHPSLDRFRETTPQGFFFAGHIWIDESIRRNALFTGYSIRIVPINEARPQAPSQEQRGLIAFSRVFNGWDGQAVARLEVQHDSPIIRELNKASRRLFIYLMIFAGGLFLILSTSLVFWVRRPLRLISRNLEKENPKGLEPLQKKNNEFGKLAQLILKFRRTEEALHETEEQLRHSQKLEAVGRLAGGIAHDFNNLLTAIIGYSELLEARLAEDRTGREHAQLIRKAGEQAAGLTRQLLAFSRKQLLQPKVLDLNALLLELQKLLQRVIGEHIRIQIQPGSDDPRVCADPNQLEQVILNLGVNARDAMPTGGTLLITTANVTLDGPTAESAELPAGDFVMLGVNDTGSGMDAPTRARIFEPFFTTKGPGKGTGLGLATVYGIVKQSHGGITVDSEIGNGSTFRIYLPRVDAPLEVTTLPPAPIEASKNRETILVVEDEEVVRQLVCAVLGDAGYHVLCAGLPSEAFEVARTHTSVIDLLVTDVVMPEMHGPLMARELSVLHPEMKVLFVSGYSESDISDQGVIDRRLDVLQKPFTQQGLARKIRELLDAKPAASAADLEEEPPLS